MAGRARVCLLGFGSAGDVHPLLALGRDLRERGHPVTLLTNPAYAQAAAAEALDFVPVGEARHLEETARHPKLWHPIDGLGVMWRYLLRPALVPSYERLAEIARGGPSVVVASPVAMGARIAQERLGLPLVSVYTAATMLRTVQDPMTLADWRVPRALPRVLRRGAWALLDRYKLEPLVRPDLDALRGSLGLPPLRDKVFGRWMHSPQGGVTLFPSWFAAPASDWPAQVTAGGFPLYDEPTAEPPPALARFVAAGAPPVVFMPGTARHAAEDFFRAAVQACERIGVRGVLLGPVPDAAARALPAMLHAAPYAPFGWLLPRARALVHHGGIGSCAQALRAGIPQLLMPHAYDQFDNAMRLESLGVGRQVTPDPRGWASLGAVLEELLASRSVAQACARWAPQATPGAAQEAVAAMVERLA